MTYNTSSGVADAGDINYVGGLATINPINNAFTASIKAKVVAGRKVTIRLSDSVYVTGVCNSGVSESFGKLNFNIDTAVVGGSPAPWVGVPTNNHAVTVVFETNIPARDELADVAFSGDAADVEVDASGFDGNLATTDTDVQKVAQKVDDLTAVKSWQGVRRRLGAKLTDSVAAADTWNNLLTISITPDAVGQKLRLRMQIYVAREQGGSNLLGIAARKVIGSWDGGLHDTTAVTRDYSPLGVRQFAQSNAWLDWIIEPFVFEAEFTAESTTTVKINVGAFCLNQADPVVREAGTLYINRAQNLPASNWPGADSNYFSWVELTKYAAGNEDITETVITALDAA